MFYPDIEKIQIQNYACQGCANCFQLKSIDLRTRQGIFTYLIKKRSCYLARIKDKIKRLQEKEAAVKLEIEQYQEQLDLESKI